MKSDIPKYFITYSEELEVVKNRVRSIIGGNHWPSDGNHKEVVLADVLKRFLPESVCISSGFVINEENGQLSKQIDILIYDKKSPVIYKSQNFVIIQRNYVRGVIEVKTNLYSNKTLKSALKNIYRAQKVIESGRKKSKTFYGIFSYGYKNIDINKYEEISKDLYKKINEFYKGKKSCLEEIYSFKLCINNHMYCILKKEDDKTRTFKTYKTDKKSFGIFLNKLI